MILMTMMILRHVMRTSNVIRMEVMVVQMMDHKGALSDHDDHVGLAALVGHVDLRRRTRALRQTLVTIRTATRMWTLLYALVGIQLAWLLRPFVGNPGLPTTFFREDTWGNAYLHLLRVLGRVLGL